MDASDAVTVELLTECRICRALVTGPRQHREWHERHGEFESAGSAGALRSL